MIRNDKLYIKHCNINALKDFMFTKIIAFTIDIISTNQLVAGSTPVRRTIETLKTLEAVLLLGFLLFLKLHDQRIVQTCDI